MNTGNETMRPNKHKFDPMHGAQGVFRLFLEALANPGRTLSMSSFAAQFTGYGQWLAPALTLLDNETGFFWNGEAAVGEEIRFLTGAIPVSPEAADFLFLPVPEDPAEFLARLKAGSHRDPHDSALLFIAPLPSEGSCRTLFLRGPGIPPEGRRIELSPSEIIWVEARDRQHFEYPQGIELVFLRDDGTILALTRKVEAEVSVSWRM
jgi:phosphonate C-P lyase system protein PhnH